MSGSSGEAPGVEVHSDTAGDATIELDITMKDVDPAYETTVSATVVFNDDGICPCR